MKCPPNPTQTSYNQPEFNTSLIIGIGVELGLDASGWVKIQVDTFQVQVGLMLAVNLAQPTVLQPT